MDRADANRKMLSQAEKTQEDTKAAAIRIKQRLQETEDIGSATLQQLGHQGHQLDELHNELTDIDNKLAQTTQLQSNFDFWAGNWSGTKKSAAGQEAKNYIAAQSDNKGLHVSDIYEQQKYHSMGRSWKKHNFVQVSNTSTEVIPAFDPELSYVNKISAWKVDFSLPNIDPEGWTYSADFKSLDTNGSGISTPVWNSYVRRRKWRHENKTSSSAAVIEDVGKRNLERKKVVTGTDVSAQKGSIDYKNIQLVDTGRVSTVDNVRGVRDESQRLDQETEARMGNLKAGDAHIDDVWRSLLC
jgi:hypothetical protein